MLGKKLIQAASGNAAGEALGIEDVFSTWLYTGNGSTQTITNGIDLAGEGGLVWTKCRSVARSHILCDTNNGLGVFLESQSTNPLSVDAQTVTSFEANGYSIGTNNSVNFSTNTFASWTFRKAPGFFDVVTWTGNGSNRTIAHSLGSVPGTIIVKRTDTAADWQVYHRSLANTEYLVLNSTAAKATGTTRWNSTTPTSTVFSLGTDTTVNANGATYVAYLFAHDEQIFGEGGDQSVIKCGSFTTDSTGRATVELGWEPQWILTKSTDNVNNWTILDTMRGLVNPSSSRLNDDALLYANTSGAESTAAGGFPTATGFAIDGSHGSANYIYIAIRRGPMKTPTDATKVFAPSIAYNNTTTAFVSTFTPDMVFVGPPAANDKWYWADRLRGANRLNSVNTNAEASNAAYALQFLGAFNGSWSGYTATMFRRAPGFFDVVAYTGTGVARTVPHNLNVAPELMIVKRRNLTESWQVYVVPVSPSSTLELNTTNAAAAYTNRWDGASTATEIKLLTHASVNASGSTYIAYLFATCPGVSKVGSYTGTGTTLNIDCGFTSGARFVLIKRTDSTGDWYVWDTARGIVSGNDPYLLLNSTAAEVTSTDYIDPLSSGFQISSTAPAAINANGGSYIYLSVA